MGQRGTFALPSGRQDSRVKKELWAPFTLFLYQRALEADVSFPNLMFLGFMEVLCASTQRAVGPGPTPPFSGLRIIGLTQGLELHL